MEKMDLSKISIGPNPPEDVHVIIENPRGLPPVKYEIDKDSGALFVDRFVHTSMVYPVNYGFIPHTLSGDGDPVDIMVVTDHVVVPGCVIRARPVGVLLMEDESGVDEKILAVPATKLWPAYRDVESYTDLPDILIDQISHFFTHYKDLEKGKWVKVLGWEGPEKAKELILTGIEAAKKA
jgi:inorganic pyrophosphatase